MRMILSACFGTRRMRSASYEALGSRLGKFGLEMAPDKTKIISFSRFRKWEKASFEFLGFEFRWGVYSGGRDMVIRRTSRKKFRMALAALTEWCSKHRHLDLGRWFQHTRMPSSAGTTIITGCSGIPRAYKSTTMKSSGSFSSG